MASSAKDIQLRELKDTVSQLKTMIAEQTELIKALRLIIDEKTSHEKALQEQVDYLTKKLAGVIMILFGRPLTKLFIVSSAFEAINASAKYLRCLGFFYWMLGILNVCRMVTQGLGYSGRAVFSGVMEMLARTIVCLGFVGAFGFTAICFADQAAWLAACCYIAPTCLYCVKKSTKMIADRGAK